MNKICYQLLDEYLRSCLALGRWFLEKYLAASRCLLLSTVWRSGCLRMVLNISLLGDSTTWLRDYYMNH